MSTLTSRADWALRTMADGTTQAVIELGPLPNLVHYCDVVFEPESCDLGPHDVMIHARGNGLGSIASRRAVVFVDTWHVDLDQARAAVAAFLDHRPFRPWPILIGTVCRDRGISPAAAVAAVNAAANRRLAARLGRTPAPA